MSGYGPIWTYCMREGCGMQYDMEAQEQPMCPLGWDLYPHYEDCEPYITLDKGVWLHERQRIAQEQGELFDVNQGSLFDLEAKPAELELKADSG